MRSFLQLFSLYPSKPENFEDLHARERLAPYLEQFNIAFTDRYIKIGNGNDQLNTLLLDHIHAIVDDSDYIYIVLHSSIYLLCKENGEVKIHIRP